MRDLSVVRVSKKSLATFVIALIFLSACSMIRSRPLTMDEDETRGKASIFGTTRVGGYFLPKRLYVLTIRERPDVPSIRDRYYVDTPTIETVPDPERFFSLDFLSNSNSNDNIQVTYDGKGFLLTVNAKAEDQSAKILAAIAKGVITLITGVPAPQQGLGRAAMDQATPIVYQTVLDITDENQVQSLNAEICSRFNKVLHPRRHATKQVEMNRTVADDQDAIFYRPLEPWIVVVENATSCIAVERDQNDGSSTQIAGDLHSAHVALLPNKAPLLRVDVPRGAFATYDNKLVFADGVLTSANYEHQSIVYGLFSALGDLANSIVAIPAQILQLRIDQTNKRNELIQAQTTLISTQEKYLAALKALEAARNPPPEGSGISNTDLDASRTVLPECDPNDQACIEKFNNPE